MGYCRMLIIVGLLALLLTGCQSESSDAPKQTILGLVEEIVANADDTLKRLSGQKEEFERADRPDGVEAMNNAIRSVRTTKKTAISIERQVDPPETASVSSAAALYGSTIGRQDARETIREKLARMQEALNRLDKNLAQAQRCCGLDRDFLDDSLQNLRTDTGDLEQEVDQFMDQQYSQYGATVMDAEDYHDERGRAKLEQPPMVRMMRRATPPAKLVVAPVSARDSAGSSG